MNTREIAQAIIDMLREGKDAGAAFWHEDVSSIEAMGGTPAVHGKEAVTAKGAAWNAAHEEHSFGVEGPYVNDDQFALHMEIDFTVRATGQRIQMKEVGVYTVQEEKVVEERFFY